MAEGEFTDQKAAISNATSAMWALHMKWTMMQEAKEALDVAEAMFKETESQFRMAMAEFCGTTKKQEADATKDAASAGIKTGATIVLYYPVGMSGRDGKTIDNDEIAQEVIRALDSGKSVAIPADTPWRVQVIAGVMPPEADKPAGG